MIAFGVFGIFLKAPGWCLGFAFLAKGESKTFFVNELCFEIYALLSNILFYHLWGLNGLGLSFIFNYIIYVIQCSIVCNKRYNYRIDISVLRFFAPQFLISLLILLIVLICKYLTFALRPLYIMFVSRMRGRSCWIIYKECANLHIFFKIQKR